MDENEANLISLPDNFKVPIFKQLDWKTLKKLKSVCRDFYFVIERNIRRLARPKILSLLLDCDESGIPGACYTIEDPESQSFEDLTNDVKVELVNNSKKLEGFAGWIRFDPLNDYLGGLRPSELTLLTGGIGYGKTTFICEYALDLCTRGVRTLMCSFEMNEEKIMRWMALQYSLLPLYKAEHHSRIDVNLERFKRSNVI
uniref:F-box domain-containing protein n=1 Tax=Strongyloides papillosus TaxID=174720 RepID=A0A0N5CBN8_STREA